MKNLWTHLLTVKIEIFLYIIPCSFCGHEVISFFFIIVFFQKLLWQQQQKKKDSNKIDQKSKESIIFLSFISKIDRMHQRIKGKTLFTTAMPLCYFLFLVLCFVYLLSTSINNITVIKGLSFCCFEERGREKIQVEQSVKDEKAAK